ncbi:MAG: hypothetical protein J6Q61_02710 [Bacteroidales bacterium]|nr:hypothetical protein [Bacteroidales bacterium]MBO5853628.1 hypothetical protein [Bacteroidales bacterium]
MDRLEQYYQDDFCIEADVLYDALKARLQNRLRQQIYKTKQLVKFPKDVFIQALETRTE